MGTPPVMPMSCWMPPMMGGPFGRHAAMWLFHLFCCFFALKVMRGHDFWTHLTMCPELVDLLPPILESGTVSGEMGS